MLIFFFSVNSVSPDELCDSLLLNLAVSTSCACQKFLAVQDRI